MKIILLLVCVSILSSTILSQCNSNQYKDTSGTCQSCVTNCEKCTNGTSCSSCSTSNGLATYFSSTSNTCKTCVQLFTVCQKCTATSCTTRCPSGFEYKNSTCQDNSWWDDLGIWRYLLPIAAGLCYLCCCLSLLASFLFPSKTIRKKTFINNEYIQDDILDQNTIVETNLQQQVVQPPMPVQIQQPMPVQNQQQVIQQLMQRPVQFQQQQVQYQRPIIQQRRFIQQKPQQIITRSPVLTQAQPQFIQAQQYRTISSPQQFVTQQYVQSPNLVRSSTVQGTAYSPTALIKDAIKNGYNTVTSSVSGPSFP